MTADRVARRQAKRALTIVRALEAAEARLVLQLRATIDHQALVAELAAAGDLTPRLRRELAATAKERGGDVASLAKFVDALGQVQRLKRAEIGRQPSGRAEWDQLSASEMIETAAQLGSAIAPGPISAPSRQRPRKPASR